MKIVIKKSGWLKEKYHFNVVAKNGEVVATSEKYHSLIDLNDTIRLIQKDIAQAVVIMEWD
jgi:uncharacterized protein YegP (UPF0339 family)